MVAAARELRDRYLEAVNEQGLLPEAWSAGKYDVSRQLEDSPPENKATTEETEGTEVLEDPRLLDAA